MLIYKSIIYYYGYKSFVSYDLILIDNKIISS